VHSLVSVCVNQTTCFLTLVSILQCFYSHSSQKYMSFSGLPLWWNVIMPTTFISGIYFCQSSGSWIHEFHRFTLGVLLAAPIFAGVVAGIAKAIPWRRARHRRRTTTPSRCTRRSCSSMYRDVNLLLFSCTSVLLGISHFLGRNACVFLPFLCPQPLLLWFDKFRAPFGKSWYKKWVILDSRLLYSVICSMQGNMAD
jgi:hypothetical protein